MDTFPSGTALPTTPASEGRRHDLSFSGRAGEYFRLWIVNLALTVVTLGVYWAWAKVRQRKYLYGHTRLDGHNFEYTADPVAILKGHLLVAVLFVLFALSQYYNEWLYIGLIVAFSAVWPLLAWQSLRFTALNTRHRGLRFHFHGSLGGAFKIFLGWPLLLIPSLGLLMPYLAYLQRRYMFGNAAYGSARATFQGDPGVPWIVYLTALGVSTGFGVLVALLVVGVGVGAAVSGRFDVGGFADDPPLALLLAVVPLYLMGIALSAGLAAYVSAALLNFSLRGTELPGQLRFESRINPWRLAWITVTNLLAQGLTLGLATPWATVRRLRYLVPLVSVVAARDLADVTAGHGEQESALGEAASDFLGIEVGL